MRSKSEHLLAFSFHKTVIFIALSHFNNKYNLALYRSIPTRVLTTLQIDTAMSPTSSGQCSCSLLCPWCSEGDKSLNDKSAKAPTDQD